MNNKFAFISSEKIFKKTDKVVSEVKVEAKTKVWSSPSPETYLGEIRNPILQQPIPTVNNYIAAHVCFQNGAVQVHGIKNDQSRILNNLAEAARFFENL